MCKGGVSSQSPNEMDKGPKSLKQWICREWVRNWTSMSWTMITIG